MNEPMSTLASQLICGGSSKSRDAFLNQCAITLSSEINWPQSPDTIVVRSKNSQIGINQIRDFQKLIQIQPSSLKVKIGIIREAHLLTVQSQNALLKTLEEPPKNVVIFLLCENEDNLIPTIVSRCRTTNLSASESSLDSQEFENLKAVLQNLSLQGVAEKLTFASQISKDRDNAIDWLNQVLIFAHQSAFSNLTSWPGSTKLLSIFESKKRLKANANVRLTMENLLINW
jgi:DNA polymerase III gamma/tau subunit